MFAVLYLIVLLSAANMYRCFNIGMLRRRELVMPEGRVRPISDLVPVWWEFHTADSEAERLNDFSFSELRARF